MNNNAKKTEKGSRHGQTKPVELSSHSFAFESELHRLIQEAAYLLAEQDGFKQTPEYYWFTAKEKVYRDH